MAIKKGPGRPPKPERERADPMTIRISKADKAFVRRAAKRAGKDMATWARATLVAQAKALLGEE